MKPKTKEEKIARLEERKAGLERIVQYMLSALDGRYQEQHAALVALGCEQGHIESQIIALNCNYTTQL